MVVATVGVYWQTQSFPYVLYDDPLYVYENHHVQQGLTLEGIGWAVTSTDASNWHPISWLSHMLDVELFGVEAAGRHHFSSVILHVLNSLLFLALLSSITGTSRLLHRTYLRSLEPGSKTSPATLWRSRKHGCL